VIINISSGASKIPPERYRTNPVAPYASTKYALNAITLIGRQQLAADNISLGLVYPGVTATNFFNTLLEGRQPASAPGGATDVASPESVAETMLEAVETQAAEVYTENLKQALSSSTLHACSFHGRGFFPGGIALDDPLTILAAFGAFVACSSRVTCIAALTQRLFGKEGISAR